MDTSPKKKLASLKHPLISRKSPLFSKFGMENENSSSVPNSKSESLKIRMRSRRGNTTVDHIDQNTINNIINRTDLNEVIEKRIDQRKGSTPDNSGNGSTNTSSANLIQEKPRENFTFYSKKSSQTPGVSITVSKEFEDNKLKYQNSLPEEMNSIIYPTKTKSLPLEENSNTERKNPFMGTKKHTLPPKQANDKNRPDSKGFASKPTTSQTDRVSNQIRDPTSKTILKRKSLLESDYQREATDFLDLTPKEMNGDYLHFNKEEMLVEYVLHEQNDFNNPKSMPPGTSNSFVINSKDKLFNQDSNKLLRKSNSESNFNFLEGPSNKEVQSASRREAQSKPSPANLYDPPFQNKVSNLLMTKQGSSETSSPKASRNHTGGYYSASKAQKQQNMTMYYLK
jgi:hypothetical protein